jgi:pilus assembly protein CpaF
MSLLKRIGGPDTPETTVTSSNTQTGTGTNTTPNSNSTTNLTTDSPNRAGGLSRLSAQAGANNIQASKQEKVTHDIKSRIQERLITELERRKIPVTDDKQVKTVTEEIFQTILAEEPVPLSRVEKQNLLDSVLSEIMGFGPLDPLLREDAISEIMVNGPKQTYIEKKGKLIKTDVTFQR